MRILKIRLFFKLCIGNVKKYGEKTQFRRISNIVRKPYITEAEENGAEIPEEAIDITLLEEEVTKEDNIKEEIEKEVPVESPTIPKSDLNPEANAEEKDFRNEEEMDNFFIGQQMDNRIRQDKKWELVGITETTKSNSQFSKNKNRFVYHIKNRISNRYHQYCLNRVNMASLNLRCHNNPKCKAMLTMEIGNF